ncbi:MAG: P27 family phage terminase small subunit [Chloroflexi bacterium]|nr:P27 family phage terminase small subunit [Chloroflexota bacterium]
MSRPRTPSKILELKGAFKTNPERARKNEPVPNAAFPKSPPKHLTAIEKKTWIEIVKHVPAGVLSDADVFQVEALSRLLALFRETEAPPMTMYQRLEAALGKLGLNPSSRAGLSVEKPVKNKYAD